MILKAAQYKKCTKCGRPTTEVREVIGCDVCKKVLDPAEGYLEISIFYHVQGTEHSSGGSERHVFCCWKHVASFLKKFHKQHKDYHFISLPYCSTGGAGQRFDDFIKLLK